MRTRDADAMLVPPISGWPPTPKQQKCVVRTWQPLFFFPFPVQNGIHGMGTRNALDREGKRRLGE
jgi:hypothetical protein